VFNGAVKSNVEIISFGGAAVRIAPRSNGWWVLRWREGGATRQTTATTEARARELARQKVRELAAGNGARLVAALEAQAIERLRAVIGTRSMSAVVEQLEDAVRRLGSWEHVGRAIDGYLRAGHGRVESVTMRQAVADFLQGHERSSTLYRAGLRKELEAFTRGAGDVAVCDVDEALLRRWIERANEDGAAPAARFFNNRLATWKTFLNWSRERNLVARGEPHAAAKLRPRKLEDKAPEIWTPEVAARAVELVLKHDPQLLNYMVIGCWMGLRPFEMRRLKWDAWDWERGYLEVGADVALKVMRTRFVPIPDNVRRLLQGRDEDARWGERYRRRARACTRVHDQHALAVLLRKHGVIEAWPQDVMRHSYISYRLAQGHGRGEVAEWAGNSESEIRRSYRRPLRKADGAAWFGVGMGGVDG
jgi:integrase